MEKKKQVIIIFTLLALILLSVFIMVIYFRDYFTIGTANAFIDNNNKVIFVSLPDDSPTKQKIYFNFPFKNDDVYIKKITSGTCIEDGAETKLIDGEFYDFGQFISHSKLIIKSPNSELEYDLWVTTGNTPIIAIEVEDEIPDEPKVDCTIDILAANSSYNKANISSRIELINFTQEIPKYSYSLNINEDVITGNVPQILGFSESKRFKLSSCYIDRSFIREKLTYDIFNQISSEKVPESQFVEIYLNGKYKGLYLLSRRVDRNMFSISNYNDEETNHGVIYEASNWRADFTRSVEGFSQIEPDLENDQPYFKPLEKLVNIMGKIENGNALDTLQEEVNIESVMDNHILFMIAGSNNELAPHQYIYRGKGDGSKFNFFPGDYYLSSFGRNENSFKINSSNAVYGNRLLNFLYENEEYQARLKDKWNKLRDESLNKENLYKIIENETSGILNAVERNFKAWPVNAENYGDSCTHREDIEYIKNFIEKRLEFLDGYLNSPEFFKIGDSYSLINEENRTIFCSLPDGADTVQNIETNYPGEMYIKPISYGIYNLGQKTDNNSESSYKGLLTGGQENADIQVWIDKPSEGEKVRGILEMSGWALNPNEKEDTGVESIYVFDGPEINEENFIGAANYNYSRIDVAENFKNPNFENCGFNIQINTLYFENGFHTFYLYACSNNTYSVKQVSININNSITVPEKILIEGYQPINNGSYDFIEYIFHGILIIKEKSEEKEYDLWVTTGDVPLLVIGTDGEKIPNYPKIDCGMQLISNTDSPNYNTEIIDSLIEVRGGSSRFSQKNSYSIKFNRQIDYDLEKKLLGMTNARKWILNGCFCDRILMRDKLSYDLFNQMRDENHYDYASQTRIIELFLNNEYRGVYLLTERVDEDLIRLADYNDSDDMHSVVYKARSLATDWQRFNPWLDLEPYDKLSEVQGYLQKEPNPDNPEQGEFWDPLIYIREFVIKSNYENFAKNIAEKFDLNNVIDFHLHALVTGNWIGIQSNRYICRGNKKDSKFFFVPWDYNISFGRTSNTYKQELTVWFTNKILDKLLEINWYQDKFKKRWNDLYGNVFSTTNICNLMDKNAELLESAQRRNFKKFPIKVGTNPLNDEYIDDYDFTEELDYVKEWVEVRLKFLNFYINNSKDLSELDLNYNITIFIDNPESHEKIEGNFLINGWTLNTEENNSTGISKIEVFKDDIGKNGKFIGEPEYGLERENVANKFENRNYLNSGFSININQEILEEGKNTFYIISYDRDGKYNIISLIIYY